MYGLPTEFDASVFVGKQLQLICFSENTISFSFDENVMLTILGSYVFQEGTNALIQKHRVPVMSSNLMCLVGKIISHAEGRADGSLKLEFDTAHVLTLIDDSKEFEAYTIRIGNKEIMV